MCGGLEPFAVLELMPSRNDMAGIAKRMARIAVGEDGWEGGWKDCQDGWKDSGRGTTKWLFRRKKGLI